MTEKVLDLALVRWFGEFAEHGIVTTDTRLTITSWNRWLERHSGRMAADVIGRPLLEVYPDLKDRGLDEHYQEALAGHAYLASHLLHGYVLPMPARVGDQVFATMRQRGRIAPLFSDERVVGTITVIDDVSERVAAEQELRRRIEAQDLARASAEKALRVKDEFLATLSHEIRTPLNAVLGWAKILTERERQLEPELLSRAISSIFRNATVQARMIDDLLDTARIMAGKLRLQMEPVDLVAVTIAAIDVLSPVIEARQVTLTRRLDSTVQAVLGDPDRLQQIIWNLMSNAVKFTEPGGTIEVHLDQVSGHARITVIDSGKGISSEFLPYVFDRFRQGDTSSTRREGGLGLGLALVRELVELHGGAVRADSAGPGKGSTFVVEFPTVVSAEMRRSSGSAGGDSARLLGVRVLVVDDDEDARELVSGILSASGARITDVHSRKEAMRRLLSDAGRPHVIVAAVESDGRDAAQFIRELRELSSERGGALPVVAITPFASPELRAQMLSAGYQRHVAKPVDATALVVAVSEAIGHADV